MPGGRTVWAGPGVDEPAEGHLPHQLGAPGQQGLVDGPRSSLQGLGAHQVWLAEGRPFGDGQGQAASTGGLLEEPAPQAHLQVQSVPHLPDQAHRGAAQVHKADGKGFEEEEEEEAPQPGASVPDYPLSSPREPAWASHPSRDLPFDGRCIVVLARGAVRLPGARQVCIPRWSRPGVFRSAGTGTLVASRRTRVVSPRRLKRGFDPSKSGGVASIGVHGHSEVVLG
ncbi:unnamed protein product [Ixodes persulcatus]